jgi:glycosyltransferase involved in cell wall biosynthesis
MPCRNAFPHLQAAVQSVLHQHECLELLVADGGSSDGSIEFLESLACGDRRVRIVSSADAGPADALNKAFQHARGTLIGWLNADDLYPEGALTRAVEALHAHPDWLMLFGEGQEFDSDTGQFQRYPTLPSSVGLDGFRSHCFICQPTVVFRRSMALLLGPFDQRWRTAFDFDYWLRAFAAFPDRIGYLPHLQGLTRLHRNTITSLQRADVAMEATELLARHFGSADLVRLHGYALELQQGVATLPVGQDLKGHLTALFNQAAPFLEPGALSQLRETWLGRGALAGSIDDGTAETLSIKADAGQ